MYQKVSSQVNPIELEEDVLRFWKREHIFRKSMANREGAPTYVFYEGPPTANGKPGSHHVLSRAFKDMFPRFQAMRGKYVLRRGGWDTHGLPVEIEVERQLGFTSKQQIEQFGIAEFNERCRHSAMSYIQDWEKLTDRIGFWVDLETAYITFTNDYIETVWWILKQFAEKDLLYRGFKVVPYCARCGTPLSDHEVALGYKDDTPDPSVYVRFQLKAEPDTYFLVWTTTPWTLPGNVALAVGSDVTYVTVERTVEDGGRERLILAKDLLTAVLGEGDHKIVAEQPGSALVGKDYRPLYTFMPFEQKAHFVISGDFVSTEDGTGIVHLAPAFGADDLRVTREHNLPILMTVNERGEFVEAVKPWRGMWVKDADPHITQDLSDRGLLFKSGTYLHTYPFCWRCDTPLLYYARNTWYIRTTQVKERLVATNQEINWYPNHIKNGRFGNWLENNVDWALGRERFWGTPLPVWMDEDGNWMAIGSVAELEQLTGRDLTNLDLHRPHVDNLTFKHPDTGKTMKRVPEVIDVWFDSGAMPYAQWHYPFENQAEFESQYPADYICEAVDQTRGWFYTLHAISTMLYDRPSFKNVISLGLILDGEGRKMSKSKGNVVDPWTVLNQHGADALRWYLYTASPPGQERRFSADLVGDVVRSFTLTFWNTYSFFVNYAQLDEWTPTAWNVQPAYTVLDRWILSELHALIRDVTTAYESYDAVGATRPIATFVDLLSNWYVRRSRRRFWRGAVDNDKAAAYATLYECLTTVSQLIAPAMPFLPEAVYQNLVRSVNPNAPESIHLTDWPTFDETQINQTLHDEMLLVMRLVSLGHNARNKANVKVRQPLAEAAFALASTMDATVLDRYADIIADELNVKAVRSLSAAGEAMHYALHARPAQLGKKYGARFPAIRNAVNALDPAAAAAVLLSGNNLPIEVDGETLHLTPDEVEVRSSARAGYATAEEAGLVAALVTTLTPDLEAEGLAREVVRRVQTLRKDSGLEISDKIVLWLHASDRLAAAVQAHETYLTGETLATELHFAVPPVDVFTSDDSFDGETLQLGLRVA